MPDLIRKPISRTKKSKSSSRLHHLPAFDVKCARKLVLSPGDLPEIPSKKKLVFATPSKKDSVEMEAAITWSPTDPAPPPSPKSN